MSLPFEIGDLLSAVQANPVHKAHVEWLRDQLAALDKKVLQLEAVNSHLAEENRRLVEEVAAQKLPADLVDAGPCYFKKNPSGGYRDTVYCPRCKQAASHMGMNTSSCVCGWTDRSLSPHRIQGLIAQLPANP